ncbi:hypothetical protein ACC719_31680 [Rhizobium ruizarguesonis]
MNKPLLGGVAFCCCTPPPQASSSSSFAVIGGVTAGVVVTEAMLLLVIIVLARLVAGWYGPGGGTLRCGERHGQTAEGCEKGDAGASGQKKFAVRHK